MSRFVQKIKKDTEYTSAIILSAGVGRRIKSYEPRSLLKVGGKTLLEHQVSILRQVFHEPDIVVAVGYAANKIMKKKDANIRAVENQLYKTTNSFESLRLGINNSIGDSVLFFHGDLYFNAETLEGLDYSKSFILVDNKNQISDREVGVTIVKEKATIFSYGLDTKWCQVAFLAGKELSLLRQICLKNDDSK